MEKRDELYERLKEEYPEEKYIIWVYEDLTYSLWNKESARKEIIYADTRIKELEKEIDLLKSN